MAGKKKTKSKTKTKAKKAKQAKKVKTKKKSAARRPARKSVAKKATKKRVRPKLKGARKPPKQAAPAAATAAPPGERIGVVTHYFNHLSVAIVQLESGSLRVGELIYIKGHTSDFNQPVESMEIDHVHVDEAHAGQTVGLRVKEHAREHDVVYKLPQ